MLVLVLHTQDVKAGIVRKIWVAEGRPPIEGEHTINHPAGRTWYVWRCTPHQSPWTQKKQPQTLLRRMSTVQTSKRSIRRVHLQNILSNVVFLSLCCHDPRTAMDALWRQLARNCTTSTDMSTLDLKLSSNDRSCAPRSITQT